MELNLYLDLNPADICTAQQKGVRIICGHPAFYTKPQVVKSNELIRRALVKALHNAGVKTRVSVGHSATTGKCWNAEVVASPIKKPQPVAVSIIYYFPFPSGASKATREKGFVPMTERPDLDNLTKSVLDMMTDCRLWDDDAQVTELTLAKWRTEKPSVSVHILAD